MKLLKHVGLLPSLMSSSLGCCHIAFILSLGLAMSTNKTLTIIEFDYITQHNDNPCLLWSLRCFFLWSLRCFFLWSLWCFFLWCFFLWRLLLLPGLLSSGGFIHFILYPIEDAIKEVILLEALLAQSNVQWNHSYLRQRMATNVLISIESKDVFQWRVLLCEVFLTQVTSNNWTKMQI